LITLQDALQRGRGNERSFNCHVHEDKSASASVNVAKGVWYCYACGAKGVVNGADIPDPSLNDVAWELAQEIDPVYYSDSWLDVFDAGPVHPYWLGRFQEAACRRFRLGFDYEEGTPTYPMRDQDGRVLGVVRRNLAEDGPKYKYPWNNVVKTDYLFNYDGVLGPTIVVVEGAMDVVACYEAGFDAVGIYGSTLSHAQIRLLDRLNPALLLLAFDQDPAGRHCAKRATAALDALLPTVEYRVVEWAEDLGNDLGDMPISLRTQILKSNEKVTKLSLA
jgi:DNA primase